MVPLTVQAHQLLLEHLSRGDVVIDATAGNGYDTLFLAEQVGPEGYVLAIDLQSQACDSCQQKVAEREFCQVEIHCRNHAELETILPHERHGQVAAVMFNLGYLPGGDKSVVTVGETTRSALSAALNVLREGGVISILVYRGHAGGNEEAAAVGAWMEEALRQGHSQLYQSPANSPISPVLMLVRKRIHST